MNDKNESVHEVVIQLPTKLVSRTLSVCVGLHRVFVLARHPGRSSRKKILAFSCAPLNLIHAGALLPHRGQLEFPY